MAFSISPFEKRDLQMALNFRSITAIDGGTSSCRTQPDRNSVFHPYFMTFTIVVPILDEPTMTELLGRKRGTVASELFLKLDK